VECIPHVRRSRGMSGPHGSDRSYFQPAVVEVFVLRLPVSLPVHVQFSSRVGQRMSDDINVCGHFALRHVGVAREYLRLRNSHGTWSAPEFLPNGVLIFWQKRSNVLETARLSHPVIL
jgi:hypothetical protein